MITYFILALVMLTPGSPSFATGWHDFSLDIAPGFRVLRTNSFDVCVGTSDGDLLACPQDFPGQLGPLVEYAVTKEAIITRHLVVRPHEKNPSILQGDPEKEFFFFVRRADRIVTGPLTRTAWKQSGLPELSTFEWVYPRNPNFWTPLLGDLFFLGFAAVYFGWPVILLALLGLSFWLYRRRTRAGPRTA